MFGGEIDFEKDVLLADREVLKMSEKVTWQCKDCGIKTTNFASNGKPLPGVCKGSMSKRKNPAGTHKWIKVK